MTSGKQSKKIRKAAYGDLNKEIKKRRYTGKTSKRKTVTMKNMESTARSKYLKMKRQKKEREEK